MRAGAADVDGTLLASTERSTEARRDPAAVIDSINHAIAEVCKTTGAASAIGVACAGQIDRETGVVVQAPNLHWRDVPLGRGIADAFGVPVTVENDVRAAAWGEFRAGAGRGVSSLVAVFVGTGIGSGAVLGGALWRGAGNAAGEVGHTQVVPDGHPCPCGQRGCLEQYCSGSGFQHRLRDALAGGARTTLADATGGLPDRLTAPMVEAAAEAGDAVARDMWTNALRYLTLGVANYVTLVNPAMLVLGGGVIETTTSLFPAVASGVLQLTTVLARKSLTVERARLGEWSGVVGAAALVAPAARG